MREEGEPWWWNEHPSQAKEGAISGIRRPIDEWRKRVPLDRLFHSVVLVTYKV